MPKTKDQDQFSAVEAKQRFEAALHGARIAGYKPQSEMKLGKVKQSKPVGQRKPPRQQKPIDQGKLARRMDKMARKTGTKSKT
jgi:hypothetical protein